MAQIVHVGANVPRSTGESVHAFALPNAVLVVSFINVSIGKQVLAFTVSFALLVPPTFVLLKRWNASECGAGHMSLAYTDGGDLLFDFRS
jgi:hypothetical protein